MEDYNSAMFNDQMLAQTKTLYTFLEKENQWFDEKNRQYWSHMHFDGVHLFHKKTDQKGNDQH